MWGLWFFLMQDKSVNDYLKGCLQGKKENGEKEENLIGGEGWF